MSYHRIRCGCCLTTAPCLHDGEESNCPDEIVITVTVPAVQVIDSCSCSFTASGWSTAITLVKSQDPWNLCEWVGEVTPECTTDTHCVNTSTTSPSLGCLDANTIYSGITGTDISTLPCWVDEFWGGCDCLERVGGVCQSDGTDIILRKPVYKLHNHGSSTLKFEYWCGCHPDQIPTTPCNYSSTVGDPACAGSGTRPDPVICCEHCGACADYEEKSTQFRAGAGTYLKVILKWDYFYERFMLYIDVRGRAVWGGSLADCLGNWGTPMFGEPFCEDMCIDSTEGDCDGFVSGQNIYSPSFEHYRPYIEWQNHTNCFPSATYPQLGLPYPTRSVWTFDPDFIDPTKCEELSGKTQSSAEVTVAQSYCKGADPCEIGEETRLGYFGEAEPFEVTWAFS